MEGGGGVGYLPRLAQRGHDIKPFDIDDLRVVGIAIFDGYKPVPDNIPNVRDPYVAFFNVGSGWGHNVLCAR